MTDTSNDTERETAEAAVNLYQSLVVITESDTLSDQTKADILEKRAEELR